MKNYNNILCEIEDAVAAELAAVKPNTPKPLYDAIEYALMSGGKRVRPTLMLLSADTLGMPRERVMRLAVALECIHTYSLIHDDLPSMDNDDYRRGRLTVHKVFGEAMAVLAGDGLLNLANEIMLDECIKDNALIPAAQYISRASGVSGMVGGQAVDITAKSYTKDGLIAMYKGKTGALIGAAIAVPYIIGAKQGCFETVKELAEAIGLVFQITDDLLDYRSGGDADKITFVSLWGENEALDLIESLGKDCKRLFEGLGLEQSDLCEYVNMLSHRLK